jgi:dTDP-4-amino-4,6-dideoxygalactose transaminase
MYAQLRKLRVHGSTKKYHHDMLGYNSRLDEVHAAILLSALEHIEDWNNRRRALADRYKQHLQGSAGIRIAPVQRHIRHIYHLFCIEVSNRSKVMKKLKQEGIHCGIYYPKPLHLQQVYSSLSYQKGDLPVAEKLADSLLAIPMSPFLTEAEQNRVIHALQTLDVIDDDM